MHEPKVKIVFEIDHDTYVRAYYKAMDDDLKFDQFLENLILRELW